MKLKMKEEKTGCCRESTVQHKTSVKIESTALNVIRYIAYLILR